MKPRLDIAFLPSNCLIGMSSRGVFGSASRLRVPGKRIVQSQSAIGPLRHESSSHHVQIRQREHRQSAHRVLVDAAVANLGKAPQTLDDVKRMLAARTRSRAAAVDCALALVELARMRRPAIYPV